MDDSERSLRSFLNKDLELREYRIQLRQLPPKKTWFLEGRKCYRSSMRLTKSSFSQTIRSSVWSLWSTTKTIWFTPVQQETFPVQAIEKILWHGLEYCGVWWFETTLGVRWRENEMNSRVYLRMLEWNVLPHLGIATSSIARELSSALRFLRRTGTR